MRILLQLLAPFFIVSHTHSPIETLRVRVIHFKFNWLTTHTHSHTRSLVQTSLHKPTDFNIAYWKGWNGKCCKVFAVHLQFGATKRLHRAYICIEYMHTNIQRVNTCTHVRMDGWTECAQNLGARKNISTKRWCL